MDWLISSAHAQSAGGAGSGGAFNIVFLIAIFGVFYFLMIRPQMKKQKEHKSMVEAISKGDEVITNGGVFGRVTQVGDSVVTVEVAPGTELKLQKMAIGKALPKGTIKALK